MASTEWTPPVHIKDPNAKLDYPMNWTDWLTEVADTITNSDWLITDPPDIELTIETGLNTNTTTTATVWLSGGTVGQKYWVTNRITTTGGRIEDRSIIIKIKEQ